MRSTPGKPPVVDPVVSRRQFLQKASGSVGGAVAWSLVANSASADSPANPAPTATAGGTSPAARSMAAVAQVAVNPAPGDPNYPPALLGMRGQNQAALQYAHALRDGSLSVPTASTGETYDLVVVGAGMSGLSAAYFYRKKLPHSKVLILDNHDDFGGHARRNEFYIDGTMQLAGGGAQVVYLPNTYSPEGKALLADIGIDQARCIAATSADQQLYGRMKLGTGAFFDRENWGADRLVTGYPGQFVSGFDVVADSLAADWAAFLRKSPLDRRARADLLRIATDQTDHLPGLTIEEKVTKLRQLSYRSYLKDVMGIGEAALKFHQTQMGWFISSGGAGPDTYSAWYAYRIGMGGFQGMGLPANATRTSSFVDDSELGIPVVFPDGMGGVARLMVRWLIPGALPGSTMEDSVSARLDYGALDQPSNAVRLRLNSTVVRAQHVGDPATAQEALVTYVSGGRGYTVRARGVVMAGFNAMIPHLCPELPDEQKQALHLAVRKPLLVINVAIRNWRAFAKAGVASFVCPTGRYPMVMLNTFPGLGAYRRSQSPDEPTIVVIAAGWENAGIPPREQSRLGRAQMLQVSAEQFEREAGDLLQRALGSYGFNAQRDIAGIMINRWAHGYAIGANELYDPDWKRDQAPWLKGRKRFGLIAIANSDAGAIALTQCAFDQANRAVNELVMDVVRPQSDLHYSETM